MEYKYGLSDKIIAYLTLISGLVISAVAVWYSVAGLVSIFSAAAVSIIIMGVALEASKLVATVWLKWNWQRAPRLIKVYLITAIAILMLITSMGIFGFLSKAHLDQNLVSGDVVDKVAIIDEKIKTQRDNIEASRKALRQMDEAVDQTMSRSTSEQGADKAANLRRAQQRERTNLQNDIVKAQAEIAKLNEQRAPIAKELRAVEAEVGPIKYIAKLIYGDNPDANLLEKAVTWVIIIIVLVFDPLAVVLLLASQYSFQWFRKQEQEESQNTNTSVSETEDTTSETTDKDEKESYPIGSALWPFPRTESADKDQQDDFKFLADDKDLYPEGKSWESEGKDEKNPIEDWNKMIAEAERAVEVEHTEEEESIIEQAADNEKAAMRIWKSENPEGSLKHQRLLLERGIIKQLPWEEYLKPQADFSDDEAALEAAKWAKEQLEKSEERGHYIGLDERPGDYVDADSKKKDNQMDGEGRQISNSPDQGRIEGYQQNAEQNESTIWQRIKKGQG